MFKINEKNDTGWSIVIHNSPVSLNNGNIYDCEIRFICNEDKIFKRIIERKLFDFELNFFYNFLIERTKLYNKSFKSSSNINDEWKKLDT